MTALARVIGPALAGLAYDAFQTAGAVGSQVIVAALGIVLLLRLLPEVVPALSPREPPVAG